MLDDPKVLVWAVYVFGLTSWLRQRWPKLDGWPVLVAVLVLSAVVACVEHVGAWEPVLLAQQVGATAIGAVAIFAGLRGAATAGVRSAAPKGEIVSGVLGLPPASAMAPAPPADPNPLASSAPSKLGTGEP